MAYEFLMPKLGHVMEEGTVVSWLKEIGDPVAKGEIILEVQNDKAIIDVESPRTGVLVQILVGPGETVPVGTALAVLGEVV